MKLDFIELELQLPEDLPLRKLRPWLLDSLKEYGEPLRWSITSAETFLADKSICQLKVEAVVILD